MGKEDKLETIVKLLAKTMFDSGWKWETPNERVMEMLMREVGMYPFKNEDEMILHTQVDDDLYSKAIREIKTIGSEGDNSNNDKSITPTLPMYRCHKTVAAVKILDICKADVEYSIEVGHAGALYVITPENKNIKPIIVSENYLLKHQPKLGGYYVRYKDGYESYSPAKEFEDGYTLIENQ